MTITHAVVKVKGERGYHYEWNAGHVVTDENLARRTATRTIAASNSNETERADYICDGVADDVQINAALNELLATGGEVRLLEGTFNLAASVVIPCDNVTISGTGRGTYVNCPLNVALFSADTKTGLLLENMRLRGGGFFAPGFDDGVYWKDVTHSAIRNLWVENCRYGICLDTNDNNDNLIEGCHVTTSVLSGIYVRDSLRVTIANNFCYANLYHGISLLSTHDCVVTGNICYANSKYGFDLSTGNTRNAVNDNRADSNVRHGFYISSSDNNTFVGNVARNNDSGATGNYDGIDVEWDTDNCTFVGNRCTGNGRNGLRINDANCDKNILVANQLLNNTGANLVDDGTNTESAHNITA